MKQIINWTCGGFFRSLGRILCYLAIGCIIAFLIAVNSDKIDPKVLGFKILGIDYVKAATITPSYNKYMTLWCVDQTCPYTEGGSSYNSGWLDRNTAIGNPTNPKSYLTHIKFRFQFNSSNYLQTGNQYVALIRWNINPRYDFIQFMPSEWSYVLNIIYSDNTTYDVYDLNVSCTKYSKDNYGVQCSWTMQPTKPIKEFTFRILFPYQDDAAYFKLIDSVNYKAYSFTGNSDTTDAINSQTIIIDQGLQEIQQQQQQTNDILNDVDTSSDSNDAIDFINDFELQGENTLLDLLFLPLDLIEDLSNQEFSDLCFTLKGKQACFPSGSILWNRNHNQSWFGNNTITINMFKTFFNLVVGGYLAYRLLMAIVNTYRKILDPVADATKVMKL